MNNFKKNREKQEIIKQISKEKIKYKELLKIKIN